MLADSVTTAPSISGNLGVSRIGQLTRTLYQSPRTRKVRTEAEGIGSVSKHRMKEGPSRRPGPLFSAALLLRHSIIHAATGHGRRRRLLLRHFGYHRFGSDEQPRNRSRILQRRADHLGRIDDPVRNEIFELAGLRVEAEGIGVVVLDLAHDDRAVLPSIDGDLARWPG